MQLHDLLGAVDVLELRPGSSRTGPEITDPHTIDPLIASVVQDSRRVAPGALFCCVPGRRHDGHDHAPAAVAAGAVALLVERALPVAEVGTEVTQVRVADVRAAIGPLAARFHGEPSAAMRVLGVTGTNGKTTVTYLLEAIGRAAGLDTGVIGTTGVRVGADLVETGFTTPEATDLQEILERMRAAGTDLVAMEVSSHALAQHRVDGTRFAAVGYTNLGQDHLDLHGSAASYRAAKARLFDVTFAPVAVVNADAAPLYDAEWSALDTITFSTRADATLVAREISAAPEGTTFVLAGHGFGRSGRAGEPWSAPVRLRLPGEFNVENALCAAGLALAAGVPRDAVVAGLESFRGVPGRLERVDAGRPFAVYVDYAHTPDGLATVLDAVRPQGAGRVLAVFGCGGDRDPSKRDPMGRAVGSRADFVILTSDNPRSEDPAAIATQAERGLRAVGARYAVELDRRAAIRGALDEARPGDVVLVLGKGSEQGQIVGSGTLPFDDRAVVREELEARA